MAQAGGAVIALYQVSRLNINGSIKILGITYLLAATSGYFVEGSENKFREALLVYNQTLLRK